MQAGACILSQGKWESVENAWSKGHQDGQKEEQYLVALEAIRSWEGEVMMAMWVTSVAVEINKRYFQNGLLSD